MKTWMFARKALLEMWRSPQLFWLFLLFPAVMVMVYYFSFGKSTGMANYVTVAVINRDEGPHGAGLIRAIREAEFDSQPALTLLDGDSGARAEILLNEGKAAMAVTIPAGFSEALESESPDRAVEIRMAGDPLTDTYAFAFSFLNEIITAYVDGVTGWTEELPVNLEFLPNTGTLNDFQIGVPGLIVFGIMFGIITNALLLTRESSDGTIRRIRISCAGAGHLLGGIALAGLVLTIVQMLITFGAAAVVGYRPVGSLALAVAVGLVVSLAATGLGFIAAGFSKTEGEATGFGTALMVVPVFFSGGIFPLPFLELFRLGDVPVQPYDILPSTLATQAIKRIILYGDGPVNLVYEIAGVTILSTALLWIGVRVFHSRVLSR